MPHKAIKFVIWVIYNPTSNVENEKLRHLKKAENRKARGTELYDANLRQPNNIMDHRYHEKMKNGQLIITYGLKERAHWFADQQLIETICICLSEVNKSFILL